ncbi:hypothetical protein GTG28_04720 [Vibrio sp. OCN044]|uniref:Uncharacterized protein n=1 Tax=Vibrio tetraodonis subsp. pristinus TaxID=2695891 RepID=A0A6L8LV01_9VIBR|nr:hypothetical protein [Vibrio tetraodonis]MYM58520.1 hypothetical protein [Vibrio tetraodonis subsp. pristinus]
MHVNNPFFNTKTTISDVDQLADRLLALSDKDAQLISDVLSLTQEDAALLGKIHQQTAVIEQQKALITQQGSDISQLKLDINQAQALAKASCENLLINPRGKINQANESDGVLAAGVYFCDGWKAGTKGAEVYRDADGFRLVSGSIVQLVPNNVDPNQPLRGNLTIVSGTPQIQINGGTDITQSDSAEYIQFEVSGDNSKFTKLMLAESTDLPVYRQIVDELTPCLRFLYVEDKSESSNANWVALTYVHSTAASSWGNISFPVVMHTTPACQITTSSGLSLTNSVVTPNRVHYESDRPNGISRLIADARP